MRKPIGYDATVDANEPVLVCALCERDMYGFFLDPVYRGEEWGSHLAPDDPRCDTCGTTILGLRVVHPNREKAES